VYLRLDDWYNFCGVNEANDVAKHISLVACRYFSRCRFYRKRRLHQYSTHLYTRSQEGCKLTDAEVTFRYSWLHEEAKFACTRAEGIWGGGSVARPILILDINRGEWSALCAVCSTCSEGSPGICNGRAGYRSVWTLLWLASGGGEGGICCRLRLKCDDTHAETRFRLSAKRASQFKSAGLSVQSTTGSRGVRISGSNVAYTRFWGSVKSTGYPLYSPVSPSLPLSRVTVCHHISIGL